jgi:chromosome partitioning protein
VDDDPQGNMTMALGFEPDKLDYTLADIMTAKINDDNFLEKRDSLILKKEGLHLIPSDIRLSAVDNSLVNVLSREYILRDILTEYRDSYDYILIDCLPSLGMLTINALAAADSLIIPVQAHFLSMKGLELLINTVNRIRKQINRNLAIDGILVTMYNQRTNLCREILKSIEETYGGGIRIFQSIISYSVKAAEPTVYGESIFEYDSGSLLYRSQNPLCSHCSILSLFLCLLQNTNMQGENGFRSKLSCTMAASPSMDLRMSVLPQAKNTFSIPALLSIWLSTPLPPT